MICNCIEFKIIEKALDWFVPFLLGLVTFIIIDYKNRILKRKKDREFVICYLQNSTLKTLPKLIDAYKYIIANIEAFGLDKTSIDAFEEFNSNSLKAIPYSDYYHIFKQKQKRKFVLLVEVISIIDYLSQHLPAELKNEYFSRINNHLEKTKKQGNVTHVLECAFCINEKRITIELIKKHIRSVEILEEKINDIINAK